MNKREFEVGVRAVERILDHSFGDDNVGYMLITVYSDRDKKKTQVEVSGNMGREKSKYLLQDLLARKMLDKKKGDEEALTKALEGNNDGK